MKDDLSPSYHIKKNTTRILTSSHLVCNHQYLYSPQTRRPPVWSSWKLPHFIFGKHQFTGKRLRVCSSLISFIFFSVIMRPAAVCFTHLLSTVMQHRARGAKGSAQGSGVSHNCANCHGTPRCRYENHKRSSVRPDGEEEEEERMKGEEASKGR